MLGGCSWGRTTSENSVMTKFAFWGFSEVQRQERLRRARSMKTLLVAVLERLRARNKVGDNVAEMVVVVLAAVLVAVLLSFAGASFGD